MAVRSMVQFDTLADMRAYDVSSWTAGSLMATALLIDINSGDAKGGLYQWSPSSAAAEDLTYYNVVLSNTTSTGRWVRVFQRVRVLPQGRLVYNGDVKTLYVPTTTNASGEATFYLTYDGTPTGTPIFSTILENKSEARIDSTDPKTAVQSYVRSQPETNSFISTTHGYYKANAVTITISMVYSPFASIGAGVSVVATIIGT